MAIGVCVDCGCGACGHHGAVENVRRSARTGNMFEERPVEVRRFACAACRALGASQHVKQGGTEAMVNEPAAPDPR